MTIVPYYLLLRRSKKHPIAINSMFFDQWNNYQGQDRSATAMAGEA